jgi:ribonuclease J
MLSIAESASKIGELFIPENLIIDVEKTKSFKDEQVCIISTGTQGEPMSALTRMASGEFNKVIIGENDTVVISASVIPGNEKMIYSVINNLYRLGAEVIYSSLEPIHVSGHACRDELKILHSLVKPKFFIPVHGEYRHLKKHAKLAESVGVKKHNILIAEIGDTAELTSSTIKYGEKFSAGSRFVDGSGIDGADSTVIRDRLHLSADGLLVVAVGVDEYSRELRSISVKYKGIVLSDSVIKEIEDHIISAFKQVDIRKVKEEELENYVKRSIKNYVFKAIKKNPVILPMVVVV